MKCRQNNTLFSLKYLSLQKVDLLLTISRVNNLQQCSAAHKMGSVDQIIFLSRSTTTFSNSKTTMLSSLETLPHHILTTVLECVDVFTLYRLERTSKTLRDVVEFNGYLKYVTSSGERLINPPMSCGEYSVHHAWDCIDFSPQGREGAPTLIRFGAEPGNKFWKERLMEECN